MHRSLIAHAIERATTTAEVVCRGLYMGPRMLIEALALAPGAGRIIINSIAPVLTDTPMTAGQIHGCPVEREREVSAIPLGRPAWPREIGRLVVYLASADADYVTGQSFVVDGGLSVNFGQGA